MSALPKFGGTAAVAVVQTVRRRASHPEEMPEYVDALAAIDHAAVPAIVDTIEHTEDVTNGENLTVLFHLLEALDRIRDRQCVPSVHSLISRLKGIPADGAAALKDRAELVRIKAHDVLADIQDPCAVDDLLELLGDGRHRVRMGAIPAIGRIADRRALVPLLRLYEKELPVSGASAQEVKQAFREIVRRNNVAPEDPVFAGLTEAERPTLERLHPAKKTNGKNGNGGSNGAAKP